MREFSPPTSRKLEVTRGYGKPFGKGGCLTFTRPQPEAPSLEQGDARCPQPSLSQSTVRVDDLGHRRRTPSPPSRPSGRRPPSRRASRRRTRDRLVPAVAARDGHRRGRDRARGPGDRPRRRTGPPDRGAQLLHRLPDGDARRAGPAGPFRPTRRLAARARRRHMSVTTAPVGSSSTTRLAATLPARVLGWGMFVPERVVTNHELEQTLDTSDEWIVERSG